MTARRVYRAQRAKDHSLTPGIVSEVDPEGLGWFLGIRPEDRIAWVNGVPLRDVLDFQFYCADDEIEIGVLRKGELTILEVEKEADDYLGVSFENPLFDDVKTCRNNCVFCFLRQIPKDMRASLHVRDDDYRLSFLMGNFITLTNLDERDWARIEEQRLSPLRISVHATAPKVRANLMRNPKAGSIMEHIERLAGMGIQMHVQIVLLRGVNDGEVLQRTLRDLDSVGEAIVSVGVVPAVYTKYREDAPSPRGDKGWANAVLDILEGFARDVHARRQDNWVYGADELYLLAGREFPPCEYYGEFHQYENGIGMVPDFRCSVANYEGLAVGSTGAGCLVVTGLLAEPEIRSAVDRLGLRGVSVLGVPNLFFGSGVTVAGLLTGQDILASVLKFLRSEGQGKLRALLVPSVTLGDGVFLDGMTPEEIQTSTGLRVILAQPTLEGLLAGIEEAATVKDR